MTEIKTPGYISQLLAPSTKPQASRKAWSIDVEQVWLPFFMATNTMQDTAIPYDALGCPLRLAFDKDGSVKFSRAGRPVTRIVKPLADSITLVRENFTANLKQYAQMVAKNRANDYQRNVKLAVAEGSPIHEHDKVELDKAIQMQIAEAVKEAEAQASTPAVSPDKNGEPVKEAVPA